MIWRQDGIEVVVKYDQVKELAGQVLGGHFLGH